MTDVCYTALDRQVRDAGLLFVEAYTPSQPNMVADRTPAISDSPCVDLPVSVGLRGNGGSVMPRGYSGTCVHCGQAYVRRSSPSFCSWDCYVASHWAERVCEQCGVTFSARKKDIRRGKMRYCSTEC
jgi:hypothetical protein